MLKSSDKWCLDLSVSTCGVAPNDAGFSVLTYIGIIILDLKLLVTIC